MKNLKIGILGSRGIPNHYGGFGQLAEYLSRGLVEKGHQVWVYNVHDHPYQKKEWNGVNILHCYDAEKKIGTAGQFIYDLNCILDSRKRQFDVIFQLGYTSSTIWFWLMPRKARVITNMDGLEWKRSKYSWSVRQFLRLAEWLGIVSSNALIADSIGIQSYLKEIFGKDAHFVAYGAELFEADEPKFLEELNLEPYSYDLLIARMEPENHIREILEAHILSKVKRKLVVVGNTTTPLGKQLFEKHKSDERLLFTQGIYDLEKLNYLRAFCNLYVHGHSVGGTNPSLLEAMAAGTPICAHYNRFNKGVLGDDAVYFDSTYDLSQHFITFERERAKTWIENNRAKVKDEYSWSKIVDGYETVAMEAFAK